VAWPVSPPLSRISQWCRTRDGWNDPLESPRRTTARLVVVHGGSGSARIWSKPYAVCAPAAGRSAHTGGPSLTLFDGTSHLLTAQIAREGLQPGRGPSNNWNPDWHSRHNLVYLTDHWAGYYGGRIDAKLCAEQQATGCVVILKISIDSGHVALFPDEDYIHHRLQEPRTEAEGRILKESPKFALSPKGIDPTESRWHEIGITWRDSLQEEGTVAAYRVEPSSIIGYHTIASVEEAGVLAWCSGSTFGFLKPIPLRVCPYGQLLKTELLNRTYSPLTVETAVTLLGG
jgi:hypothetical protein